MDRKDINDIDDIRLLVNEFYSKVRKDGLLGNIFEERIGDDWDNHLNIMYSFWQTLLFRENAYRGNPGLKHLDLPVNREHFDRWLQLFYETIDNYFAGEKAEEAKWRAANIAEMFQRKIEYFRNPEKYPLNLK